MKSGEQLRALLGESERLWNTGDREGWLALWKEAVPGDYSLETPVGSEPRRGWEACRRAAWEDFQGTTKLQTHHMIVCGNEVAAFVENVVSTPDGEITMPSIDVYCFTDDGGCIERNYFELNAID